MKYYRCKVSDMDGNILYLIKRGSNISTLYDELKESGYTLLNLKKEDISNKLKQSDIIEFTYSLKTLLESGLSLKSSLESMRNRGTKFEIFITEIIGQIEMGNTLSSGLKLFRGFSKLYISLIELGESTGSLVKVLEELYTYLEKKSNIREKVTTALIYPCMTLCIGIIFVIVFITLILPGFTELISTMNPETLVLIQKRAEHLTIGITLFLALSLLLFILSLINRGLTLRILISTPFIGNIILQSYSYNIAFSLYLLISNNFTIEKSLSTTKEIINNTTLNREIDIIIVKISKGLDLSLAFLESIFPNFLGTMIEVGEKTGDLESILSKVVRVHLKDLTRIIDSFLALLEPIITIVLGATLIVLIYLFIYPLVISMGNIV